MSSRVPPNDSRTQLVAVLERLTLALDTPEQFALGSDTEAFVEVLERLTLALKSSDHKAITDKTESMPTDNDQDNPVQPVQATRKPEEPLILILLTREIFIANFIAAFIATFDENGINPVIIWIYAIFHPSHLTDLTMKTVKDGTGHCTPQRIPSIPHL